MPFNAGDLVKPKPGDVFLLADTSRVECFRSTRKQNGIWTYYVGGEFEVSEDELDPATVKLPTDIESYVCTKLPDSFKFHSQGTGKVLAALPDDQYRVIFYATYPSADDL